MKKFLIAVSLLLCFNSASNAQEVKWRAVKPLSIVRNSVCFCAKVTGKVLEGAKKIVTAPLSVPLPKIEVKRYKYTFPKLKWERGKLEEVKPEAATTDSAYDSKAQWRRNIRIEAEALKILAPRPSNAPEILAPRPADSELLDLPRVRPQVTLS